MKTASENLPTNVEQRLFQINSVLLVIGGVVAGAFFGTMICVSFLAGGLLGGLGLAWLRRGLRLLFLEDQKTSKRRVLAGFLLRLLLIPLCLYVMIRFLFLSVPAAVAGFAVFHFSVFIEGILEAIGIRSKNHA